MKRIILTILIAFMSFSPILLEAKDKAITDLELTNNNGRVTISGNTEALAVTVSIYDETGTTLINMLTTNVKSNNTFAIETPLKSGKYLIKVADYDGGEYQTGEITIKKQSSTSSSTSSKEEIKYDETDKETGVQIVTTSKDVPSDTVIKVETIKENTKRYIEIKDVLKVNKFLVFDISLYSPSLRKNITKLSSGEFEVTIPIGKEYYGKKMYAYYIKSDKSLEEYPITMDRNGNATFRTTHFSEYIISEKINYKVAPNTGDNILSYLIITIVSGLALVGTLKIKKHLY